MNALETNRYTEAWRIFGESVPMPRAILVISAHWYTNATAVTAIEAAQPALAVVDSVQTLGSDELGGPAGSVGQVREVAARLAEVAKAGRTCVALVGHVTKEGTVAGPRTLEHLVDAVIYLEGERLGATRLLRAAKNRFGSTDEVGVLEMRGDGLAEVDDASRFFIESDEAATAGSAVTLALEGTRPLAVEIQALSAPSGYGSPRRATTGIDVNRVLMLIAVLARHERPHLDVRLEAVADLDLRQAELERLDDQMKAIRQLLLRIVGPDRCLFGTERPGAGSKTDPRTGKWYDDVRPNIESIPWLTADDKGKIFEKNAAQVFSRFKQ